MERTALGLFAAAGLKISRAEFVVAGAAAQQQPRQFQDMPGEHEDRVVVPTACAQAVVKCGQRAVAFAARRVGGPGQRPAPPTGIAAPLFPPPVSPALLIWCAQAPPTPQTAPRACTPPG